MNYLYSKNKITNRESNFELLRIICMLLIIWGHLTNQYSVNEPILETIYHYCPIKVG